MNYPNNQIPGQQWPQQPGMPGQQQQQQYPQGAMPQQPQYPQQPGMPGQQQQQYPQGAMPQQQQQYSMDYFTQEGFETIADGDRNPLKFGTDAKSDMLPGEQVVGTVLTIYHGESKWQGQGDAKPYAAVQLRISSARNNKALINQTKTLFLRGQYLDNFMAAKWGLNDTLSVGYGGKQDTGKGNPRHLLYIQGQRAANSVFVPRETGTTPPNPTVPNPTVPNPTVPNPTPPGGYPGLQNVGIPNMPQGVEPAPTPPNGMPSNPGGNPQAPQPFPTF